MTKQQALADARRRARKYNVTRFVVLDCDGWQVATESELDWFYAGCTNVIAVEPDGYTYV